MHIDKGDANSHQPSQSIDHVIVRDQGRVVGCDGKPIGGSIKDDPVNAYIPLSEWLTWSEWNKP